MPEPTDAFEPRMPEVDRLSDPHGFFLKARNEVAAAAPCVGVVTPGRMVMLLPAPKPGTIAAEHVAQARQLIPSDKPLRITVVGYTQLEPLQQDTAKCLPTLGRLLGLAYLGHSVVVFEGHPSAFESGIRSSDVLVVDSAMGPFLQPDWADVAWRGMTPGARILVHDRKSNALKPVVRSKTPPGWRLGEPDGEASYLNCLLRTLAKRTPVAVEVVAGRGVPNLAALASDAQELEWIESLPFRYDALSAEKVIAIALKVGKWSKATEGETTGVVQAKLAVAGKLENVSFQMRLAKDAAGVFHLHIERSDLPGPGVKVQ